MPEPSSGTIDTAAGAVSWRRLGSGPPLVLVNGYAASKNDWDPAFLEGLAASSTVYLPDNRGIGESPESPDGISIDSMAADTLAFIDAIGLESTDLAGWSMGGFIAQSLASLAPERFTSLVLMATDPGGQEAVQCSREVGARLFDHSGTPDEMAERLIGILFPPDVAREVYREFGPVVAAAQKKLRVKTANAQAGSMMKWFSEPSDERLAAITAPVMIATGTEDVVIPPVNAINLARRLPASWLARFRGGGHAFMAQEPERVAATINAFTGRS
ncbi:MAG: alpha/beta hydrolase [Solirubrobacterales bacterium]